MKKMFDYLDRYYLKNGNERCHNLVDNALFQFKERIFDKKKVEFVNAILQEIHKDRENEIVD
jgi:phosphomevalonate kinase